jgi:tetratricopeptide (TPR) repeat protein
MPERHRTLRTIFDHSWKLLPEPERSAFVRLSIFHDGFNREAALEIASTTLHQLSSLTDKSFLRRIDVGRFEIHPLLRQYAAEMLSSESTAHDEVQSRHARYFVEWLAQMHEKLKGSEQVTALAALRVENQNLLNAWRFLIEQRDLRQLRRLLIPLVHFFTLNDQRVEVPELTRLLMAMLDIVRARQAEDESHAGPSTPLTDYTLLALTLASIRYVAIDFEHMERSNQYQAECLKYMDSIPDSLEKAFILMMNATGPMILDAQLALDLIIRSSQLFDQVGDTWGTALAQLILADIASFGKKDSRWGYLSYQASLETFTRLGNSWGRAVCLNGLLYLEYEAGNLKEAYRVGRECLDIYNMISNFERMASVRHLLGEISEKLGSLDEARQYFERNLAYYTHIGNQAQIEYFKTRMEAVGATVGSLQI